MTQDIVREGLLDHERVRAVAGEGAPADKMHTKANFGEVRPPFVALLLEELHAHLDHSVEIGKHPGGLTVGLS